ncbi:hypothetical protein SRABI02_03606 [Plantibacter cousiniae]|nr:hypothetical protein SRABI02_03606 [Plantibacter cousiniae]
MPTGRLSSPRGGPWTSTHSARSRRHADLPPRSIRDQHPRRFSRRARSTTRHRRPVRPLRWRGRRPPVLAQHPGGPPQRLRRPPLEMGSRRLLRAARPTSGASRLLRPGVLHRRRRAVRRAALPHPTQSRARDGPATSPAPRGSASRLDRRRVRTSSHRPVVDRRLRRDGGERLPRTLLAPHPGAAPRRRLGPRGTRRPRPHGGDGRARRRCAPVPRVLDAGMPAEHGAGAGEQHARPRRPELRGRRRVLQQPRRAPPGDRRHPVRAVLGGARRRCQPESRAGCDGRLLPDRCAVTERGVPTVRR